MGTKHKFKNLSVKKDGIPQQLIDDKSLKWVTWKLFGKQKIPVHPQTGKKTDANDPKIQMTFEDAIVAGHDGIGIALGSGIGYTIIDFDDCAVDGKWDPEIKAIVEDFDTYTEQSPSGNGVKLWLIGEYDMSQWKNSSGRCEIYTNQNPYMTVTGRGNGKPIVPLDKAKVDALCQKYLEPASAPIEFEPIEDVDQEEAKAAAVEKCLAIEPEINNDGSGYVMKVYKVCVLCGCEFDTAQEVLDEVLEAHGESLDHDAEWFEKRYSQALERNGALFGSELAEEVERTDLYVAKRVCQLAKDRIFYVRAWKSWVWWNGKHFACDDSDVSLINLIEEVSRQLLKEAPDYSSMGEKEARSATAQYNAWCMSYQSRKGIDNVLRLCRSILGIGYESFDQKTNLYHCDNVVIHLAEQIRIEGHNPATLNTHMARDIVHDPNAKCPRWEQFIREVFVYADGTHDKTLAEYVQKLFGYFLTGRTDDQSVYLFYGSGGNGKGKLIDILLKLLGDYGATVNQKFFIGEAPLDAIADLYGRRFAVAQETDRDVALKEAQIKSLTGGDRIRARRLYQNLWEFTPTHKLVLATNNKPVILGTDRGIWRRIKPVPFLAEFETDQEPDLMDKLLSEMSGILNWALKGYNMMLLDGLSPPKTVLRELREYREDMDSIAQWVEDRCQLDPDHSESRARLYRNYVDYCQDEGHKPRSNRQFYGEMKKLKLREVKLHGERRYAGIGLMSEFLP